MIRQHSLAIIALLLFMGNAVSFGQYTFTETTVHPCTSVKSQDRTGTCWSFATTSFLESELIRLGGQASDLSEMYSVRNIYRDKARNYVLRQGKANFSQGSLSHDVLRALEMYGALPESAFSGKNGSEKYDHSEMERALKGLLDGVIKGKKPSDKWPHAVEAVLDAYLGEAPKYVVMDEVKLTPEAYRETLPIIAEDYVSVTSFTHHPYYSPFILEIPDNYSNGMFYNLPIDELLAVIDNAIGTGHTVAWDGDVGEKGFSAREGIAVLPVDPEREDLFEIPGDEKRIDQQKRQQAFESYQTTDDHLMHLVGMAQDQNGTTYYKIKNSWGEISDYNGFLYMSRNYAGMKTMAIMVHKDAIPADIQDKLGLE